MSHYPLLVTGASGHLGKKAVATLLERGVPAASIIAVTRNPEKLADLAAAGVDVRAGDFDDTSSLAVAFRGAKRALLVSTDALDRPGRRLEQHLAAIDALRTAGVAHIVYTSLTNPHPGSPVGIAPDHRLTEAALAALPAEIGWTVLRNNLYSDLFLGALPGAIASGQLVDARADGATAFVTRDDTARAAAGALIDDVADDVRRVFEVSGPELLTSKDVAAIASTIGGKPVTHISVPLPALVQGLVQHGFPEPVAALFASFDAAIARHELAIQTTAVQVLTGRPPETLASFLARSLSR